MPEFDFQKKMRKFSEKDATNNNEYQQIPEAAQDDIGETRYIPTETRILPIAEETQPLTVAMPSPSLPSETHVMSAPTYAPSYAPSNAATYMNVIPDSEQDRIETETAEQGQRKKGGGILGWFMRPAKHGFLSSLLWLATFCCIGVMALRMLPESDQNGRALPEIIAFVPVCGIISLVIAVLALLWHRRVLLVVSLICVIVQISWHIGFFMPTARISDEARNTVQTGAVVGDNVARLMTLNTKEGAADANAIVSMVRSEHVEVLTLQEVSQSLLDALYTAGLYDVLPYYVVSVPTASDNGGMNGVWSMAPMSNVSQSLLPIETSQMPAGTVMMGDVPVRFVSAHPNSPTRGKQSLWSEGLGTIGDLKNYDWTYVIMGDFNSTWDHPRFRSLLGDTFVDAGQQSGEGFHFTYPGSSKIPALIEIDHIVHDKSVVVSDLDTVDIAGTDHKALLGTLEVTGE